MSRNIDPYKPLSKRDREYLEQWSRHGDILQHEVNLAALEAEAAEDGESDFDQDLVDFVEKLKADEIRVQLKERKLPASGNIQEIAGRLLNALQDEREAESVENVEDTPPA